MESAIMHLEQTIQQVAGSLIRITCQISAFEEEFRDPDHRISILNLLQLFRQVRNDYESVRQDILEAQQLQEQLLDSLKAELSHVHSKFNLLRNKIVG